MTTITLAGISLGSVNNISGSKQANVSVYSISGEDSSGSEAVDFGGSTKSLTISGMYVASSISELKSWIESVEALITPESSDYFQEDAVILNTELTGNLYLFINEFNWSWSVDVIGKIDYSLKVTQANNS